MREIRGEGREKFARYIRKWDKDGGAERPSKENVPSPASLQDGVPPAAHWRAREGILEEGINKERGREKYQKKADIRGRENKMRERRKDRERIGGGEIWKMLHENPL